MGAHLYVYYTLPAQALAATVADARAMQSALVARFPGLRCGLMCRSELRADGRHTLMETYAGADDLPALRAALAQAAGGLPQPRHDEVFEALG